MILWPNILQDRGQQAVDAELIQAPLLSALKSALDQLIEMRQTEGEALYRILKGHVTQMRALLSTLHGALPELKVRRSQALKVRLEALLQGEPLDPQDPRLLMELALLADKADVAEELNRIDAHLAHLDRLLTSGDPSGRRCDFLCQELLRETNTASAKLHDVGVTHLLVELKAEIERLREQIQNIE